MLNILHRITYKYPVRTAQ